MMMADADDQEEKIPEAAIKIEIKTEVKGQSAMPEGMGSILSKQDIRNLVESLPEVYLTRWEPQVLEIQG